MTLSSSIAKSSSSSSLLLSSTQILQRIGIEGIQKRGLNLHEYQGKELLRKFGVSAQQGWTASTPEEAGIAARRMMDEYRLKSIVMKAQVFAGGRGKGTMSSGLKGGVQFTKNPDEAKRLASQMLGYYLRTHQTGPKGLYVSKLLLHEGVKIEKEFYLALILDRSYGGPVLMVSRMGGVDIEEVSAKHPEAICMIPIDILKGPSNEDLERVAKILLPNIEQSVSSTSASTSGSTGSTGGGSSGGGSTGASTGVSTGVGSTSGRGSTTGVGSSNESPQVIYDRMRNDLKVLVERLYEMFKKCDASQVEINPLAITNDNQILCVDAKLNFDDNAQFRQKSLFDEEDISLRDKRELEAEKHHLQFISMEGNIGCLVNGAGLAMATMDIIQLHGGKPANFLDLGGGATQDQVLHSLAILKSDPNVKTMFINIFGGITRCDTIAHGIVEAAKSIGLSHPLVVRLVGNNAQEARRILNDRELLETYGLKIISEDDFATASKIACAIAKL